MHFSLANEAEVMVHIRFMVPLAHFVLTSKVSDSHDRVHDIKALEKKRQNIENKWLTYQRQINKGYNKRVRPRTLKVCDLVLKTAWHIKNGLKASKFVPKWEGRYIVHKVYDNCYFLISHPNCKGYLAPIHSLKALDA